MTATDAYDKYPMLKNVGVLEMVVLRHEAIKVKDTDFQAAIDAIMKELQEGKK